MGEELKFGVFNVIIDGEDMGPVEPVNIIDNIEFLSDEDSCFNIPGLKEFEITIDVRGWYELALLRRFVYHHKNNKTVRKCTHIMNNTKSKRVINKQLNRIRKIMFKGA